MTTDTAKDSGSKSNENKKKEDRQARFPKKEQGAEKNGGDKTGNPRLRRKNKKTRGGRPKRGRGRTGGGGKNREDFERERSTRARNRAGHRNNFSSEREKWIDQDKSTKPSNDGGEVLLTTNGRPDRSNARSKKFRDELNRRGNPHQNDTGGNGRAEPPRESSSSSNGKGSPGNKGFSPPTYSGSGHKAQPPAQQQQQAPAPPIGNPQVPPNPPTLQQPQNPPTLQQHSSFPGAAHPYGVPGQFPGFAVVHPQLAYPQTQTPPHGTPVGFQQFSQFIQNPVSPAQAAGPPTPFLVQQQINAAHGGAVYNPAFYNPAMGYSPWLPRPRTNTKPIRSDVEFIALYLTTDSVERLKSFLEAKEMQPLAATEPGGKDAPHCLVLFRPSKEELQQFTPGDEAQVTITGWIKHEAELVTLHIDHPTIRSENPVPHITTRQARGRPPSWTNTLIKTSPVNTVSGDGDELKLKTRLGMYHRYSQTGPTFE